jgi:hypothetical protein
LISSLPRAASAQPFSVVDIDPSGEQVQRVPLAFAVALAESAWNLHNSDPHAADQSSRRQSVQNACRFFSDSPRDTRHPTLLDRRPKTQLQQRALSQSTAFQHPAEHSVDLVGVGNDIRPTR